MSGFLVDTDWIIDSLHGRQNARDTLVALNPHGIAISVISYGELYHGAIHGRDPEAALADLAAFIQGKVLLPVTKSIAERFGVLRGSLSRQTRDQVGDLDLLIASTAMVHDLTLPTRNQRDFQLIPGLNLYELHE